jgi:hypothetical protein
VSGSTTSCSGPKRSLQLMQITNRASPGPFFRLLELPFGDYRELFSGNLSRDCLKTRSEKLHDARPLACNGENTSSPICGGPRSLGLMLVLKTCRTVSRNGPRGLDGDQIKPRRPTKIAKQAPLFGHRWEQPIPEQRPTPFHKASLAYFRGKETVP